MSVSRGWIVQVPALWSSDFGKGEIVDSPHSQHLFQRLEIYITVACLSRPFLLVKYCCICFLFIVDLIYRYLAEHCANSGTCHLHYSRVFIHTANQYPCLTVKIGTHLQSHPNLLQGNKLCNMIFFFRGTYAVTKFF